VINKIDQNASVMAGLAGTGYGTWPAQCLRDSLGCNEFCDNTNLLSYLLTYLTAIPIASNSSCTEVVITYEQKAA